MAKKHIYDLKTGQYIPTFEELGYSELEVFKERDEEQEKLFEQEYDRRLKNFQAEYESKKRYKDARKRAKKERDAEFHWYVTNPKFLNMKLIEESRRLAPDILDDFSKKATIESMAFYYQSLKARVLSISPELYPADQKKLERFPKYDVGRDCLFGSAYSFIRLWSHVYKIQHRKPRTTQHNT